MGYLTKYIRKVFHEKTMYLSLNWLNEFVNIPKSMTPEELGLRLTTHTVEVDGITKQADTFKNVVVGEILEIKAHPNAERLQLATVSIGAAKLSIVCGAPNIAVGQLAPVALPGAVLPSGLEIKESEIRGVKSGGMLCAEDELGLGNDHAGILILEKRAKIGQKFGEYLGLKDVIFTIDNISITHRPDLWSHQGMAREIAAFLGLKFKPYAPDKKIMAPGATGSPVKVTVADQALCPRYMAVAVSGIKIEPSPAWMQERLIAGGVRPISNIVDVTNYVLLELGQPLHAFDRSFIDEIVVRRAKPGETIETLDAESRKLDPDMLVIADSSKAVAVAGVMGGALSEIGEATASIIIESANFDFISIRRTAQKLGLRTEASIRYEKALDPNLCELGLYRAVELIKRICPQAEVAGGITDEKKFDLKDTPIALDLKWLKARLGENLTENKAVTILERLGFRVAKKDKELLVTVPTWRATRDISMPEDLLEEIARVYGYNNINPQMPLIEMKSPLANDDRLFERKIKTILCGAPALAEVENYSFVGEDLLSKLGIESSGHWRLANPIASHQTMLRQSLVPNLLLNVKSNQARFEQFGLFEVGSVFLPFTGEIPKKTGSEEKLPYQEKRLAVVVAGDKWGKTFDQAKAVISLLLSELKLLGENESAYEPISPEACPAWADEAAVAAIVVRGKPVGLAARLGDRAGQKLGLKKEATVCEVSLKEIFNFYQGTAGSFYSEPPKFPPLMRDLAFVVSDKMHSLDILRVISGFDRLIKSAELFDSFSGGKLGAGLRNLAFHIIYQADRTLTAEEVDKIQQALVKNLEERFEAKIRDF